MRLVLLSVFLMSAACTSTGRYVEAEAYDRCRDVSEEAAQRCIEQERDRLKASLAERDEEILEEVQRESERSAMRRGEQVGRPSAAGGKAAPDHDRPLN
ncbi:hypothetical protein [Parvularcula maris]|uniref:Lipoprotein n=1 Tax=Parvularcula maris TaxID=2965077 RepID=A0A9X2L7T5_9PROT|nr:hypothetical protein [Parvularcula maris]MCQ8184509.1 hypothetical protein [Parvularcula maris]